MVGGGGAVSGRDNCGGSDDPMRARRDVGGMRWGKRR